MDPEDFGYGFGSTDLIRIRNPGKNYNDFLVKKVRFGPGITIPYPNPTWLKSSRSYWIQTLNTGDQFKNTSESALCGEKFPVMSFIGFDCPVSVFRSLCFVTHRVQILLYTFLNYSDKLRVINLRHSFHYCILRSCLTLSKLNANFFLVFTFYNVSLSHFFAHLSETALYRILSLYCSQVLHNPNEHEYRFETLIFITFRPVF